MDTNPFIYNIGTSDTTTEKNTETTTTSSTTPATTSITTMAYTDFTGTSFGATTDTMSQTFPDDFFSLFPMLTDFYDLLSILRPSSITESTSSYAVTTKTAITTTAQSDSGSLFEYFCGLSFLFCAT